MGVLENFELGQEVPAQEEQVGEIERGAWENLFVSMERSFYNIVDLAGTSVRKLSTFSFDEDDPRKKTGVGWIGRHAGKVAADFRERAEDPDLAPETDPELMDKFAELVGTTVPYTVAALAGGAVSAGAGLGVGIGAAVASFASMREDAYRSAINTGATHDEANTEGNIVGGINALIEWAQIGGILRQSKTGAVLLKSITLSARNKAWGSVLKAGGKLSMGMVRNAAEEALEEALQGTTSELVPKLLRGKEIEGGAKGFLGRRAREAGAGALIGGVFSGIGQLGTTAMEAGKAYIPAVQEIEDFNAGVQPEDGQAGITPQDAETDTDLEVLEQTDDVPVDEEQIQEGETESEAQGKDSRIEGNEDVNIIEEIEPDTRKPIEVIIDKIKTAVAGRDIGKIRKVTDKEISQEKAKRTQAFDEVFARAKKAGLSNEDARIEASGKLAGTLPEAVFEPIPDNEVTSEDWDDLRSEVWDDTELQVFEKNNAVQAINELASGIVPNPSNLKILGKIVGPDVSSKIGRDLRTVQQVRWDTAMDLLNLPRTLLVTFDISLMGRQGLLLLADNPKQWAKAWGQSYKAFIDFWGSEQSFTSLIMKEHLTRAGYRFGDRHGLKLTALEGGIGELDERFVSRLARKIPIFGHLIQASERAAVVGMNSLRTQVFDNTVREWEGSGKTSEDYDQLANIVNISTGIGKVGSTNKQRDKRIKAILPIMTAAFFAPMYTKSRFDILGELGIAAKEAVTKGQSISPARKILVRQMTKFVAAGMMAMFLASLMGADVEEDPRSSDFGKIKLGRTRVDVWAGFQQIARTTAQLLSAQGKSLRSGEIYTKNRLDVVGKFIQSKLSPLAGLAVDLASGEDFLGEPLPTFEDKGKLMEYVYSKLAPLVIQDTIEAVQTEGWVGGLSAGAAAFNGIGVQTFERTTQDNLTDLRDKFSIEVYQRTWENIGPLAQKLLRMEEPSIVEQEKIAKFERRNATFDATRQREAGAAVEKKLPDSVMDEMDSLSITVGGLSRTIVRNWRLNAKLYKRYQDDVATKLTKELTKLINSSSYKSWTPATKQRMLDFHISRAKASVRRKIVMDANMSSFEDIRTGVEDD